MMNRGCEICGNIRHCASQAALDNPKQFGQLQKTLENRLFLMVGFSLSIFMAAIVITIHTNYRNTIIIQPTTIK